MRSKIFFATLSLIAVALAWTVVRSHGARLEAELLAARDRQRQLSQLKDENARLLAQGPDLTRANAANHALAEATRLQQEITKREEAPRPAPFTTGEWTPAAAWSNRGVATPRATVETALWAAAGGDVSAFLSVLEFDETARAKAGELLGKLPAESRHPFPNAESLIASVTLGRIPLAEAQLAWFHAIDDDHASAALLLHGAENLPRVNAQPPSSDNDDPADLPSTGYRDDPSTRMTTLSLRRTDAGWRLVVPAAAIDRIGRELLATNK